MKTKVICIILVIALSIGTFGIQAIAATQSELENQQNEINNQISDTEDQIEEVESQLSEAAQEVQDLVNQIGDYEDSISALNTQISEKETEISTKEQEISDTQKDIDEKQALLEQRLVSLYMNGQTSYIDLLLSSDDLSDFISKYYLISELATYDTDLIQSIRDAKTELEAAKTDLEATKTELESNRTELQTAQAALESTRTEKEAKVASLTSEEAELTAELEELREQESQVSSQIQKLKEEYDRKMAESSKNNSSGSSSSGSGSSDLSGGSTSSYGFGWPVANPSTLGTLYGVSGKYWTLGYHTGIDFRVSSGTAIYSIGDGQVVDTGYSNAYGNYVEIYHGNNIYSFYAHNTRVLVSTGDTVSKGEQISVSGATGNVTGPHLHFEIRTPGSRFANCVNPLPYLP